MNSIKNGGGKKLQFKTEGHGTCESLCAYAETKICPCKHGYTMCKVRILMNLSNGALLVEIGFPNLTKFQRATLWAKGYQK